MRELKIKEVSSILQITIYTCGICNDFSFDQSITCKRHMEEQHSGFGLRCSDCRVLVSRHTAHKNCNGQLKRVNRSTMTFTRVEEETYVKFLKSRESRMIIERVSVEEKNRRTRNNKRKSQSVSNRKERSLLAGLYQDNQKNFTTGSIENQKKRRRDDDSREKKRAMSNQNVSKSGKEKENVIEKKRKDGSDQKRVVKNKVEGDIRKLKDLADELATSADEVSIYDPEEVQFISDDEAITADVRKMVEERISPIKEEKKIKC